MTYNSPVQEWAGLTAGDKVVITEPGRDPYPGSLETKTADSAVVWVVDGGGQRRAFDHREGVRIAIVPVPVVAG